MRRALIVMMAMVCGARIASAQVAIQRISDQVALGGAIGRTGNGEDNGGTEAAALVEIPAAPAWRIRGDVGYARVSFPRLIAPPSTRQQETVSLTRGTVALVHRLRTGPVAPYVGGGAAAYRYAVARGTETFPTRLGLFGLAGLEVPTDTQVGITAEIQVRNFASPPVPGPAAIPTLFPFAFLVGARWRF